MGVILVVLVSRPLYGMRWAGNLVGFDKSLYDGMQMYAVDTLTPGEYNLVREEEVEKIITLDEYNDMINKNRLVAAS